MALLIRDVCLSTNDVWRDGGITPLSQIYADGLATAIKLPSFSLAPAVTGNILAIIGALFIAKALLNQIQWPWHPDQCHERRIRKPK